MSSRSNSPETPASSRLILPRDDEAISNVTSDRGLTRTAEDLAVTGFHLPSPNPTLIVPDVLDKDEQPCAREVYSSRSQQTHRDTSPSQNPVTVFPSTDDNVEQEKAHEEDNASAVVVDPASGQSSDQLYLNRISSLEGELKHYQLRVAGVSALASMLSQKTSDVEQWKDKAERLEIALDRQEHKSDRLEREVRDLRDKYGDDSARRMAPTLQPSRQILNTIMKENAQLKIALSRLVGNGNSGYKEGLKMSKLQDVIQEQNAQIQHLYSELHVLKGDARTLSHGFTADSGLGSTLSGGTSSFPSTTSSDMSEIVYLRNEVHKCESLLEKRKVFIEALSANLAQYQESSGDERPVSLQEQHTAAREEDKQKIAELERNLRTISKTLEDRDATLNEVSAELEQVRGEFAAKQKELVELERNYPQLTRLSEDSLHWKAFCAAKDKESRLLLEQVKSLQKKLAELESASPGSELERLNTENASLRTELDDIKLKFQVHSDEFEKFENLRDELEKTNESLRTLRQEKRLLADKLQGAEQNYDSILQQYTKTRAYFIQQQNMADRSAPNTTGLTGMGSAERGRLFLPSSPSSSSHSSPFLISVRDGARSGDSSCPRQQQQQAYTMGGSSHLQNAAYMSNEITARTPKTAESTHAQDPSLSFPPPMQQQQHYPSHSYPPPQQQQQQQYTVYGQSQQQAMYQAGSTSTYGQRDSIQRHSGSMRPGFAAGQYSYQQGSAGRVVGTTTSAGGYSQSPHLVTTESAPLPLATSAQGASGGSHSGRPYLTAHSPTNPTPFVAEPRDNSGNSSSSTPHFRTTTSGRQN